MLSIFTKLAAWLAYSLFALSPDSKLGEAIQFFIGDTTEIFSIIVLMIYILFLFIHPSWVANQYNLCISMEDL
jgi:hypothetical protein